MKKIADIIKTVWVVLWWASVTLIVALPIGILGFFGPTGKLAFKLCQVWVWLGKTICFTRMEYQLSDKIDPKQSYMLVSNHQSLLDIPALMLMGIQFRWVLKKEIGRVPLFGWALYWARHVMVDRSKPKVALKSMNQAMKKLPEGVSVAIFPEGTRQPDGQLGEFKIGAFLTAISTGMPIVPITINGSWRIMPSKSSLSFYPGKVQVIAGDPIDVSGYSKREISKLMNDTKEIIASRLDPEYPN